MLDSRLSRSGVMEVSNENDAHRDFLRAGDRGDISWGRRQKAGEFDSRQSS